MRNLCGRMKGEVDYQIEAGQVWIGPGMCYIDDDRGSLLFDPAHNMNQAIPLIGDLRGCRVYPIQHESSPNKCLQIVNHMANAEVILKPRASDELDLWLASLLCWQQVRPSGARSGPSKGNNVTTLARPPARRSSSTAGFVPGRDGAIIKVGKVLLWDKGVATSPRAVIKRSSTRDLQSASTTWRRVSCILSDNGDFKLMTENDVAILSVIELSHLSRSAIQQLDKSVLDEDYCIAIFPIYALSARQLSIFRPVYLSLESRVLFEVWFTLLRTFAVPELYGFDAVSNNLVEVRDLSRPFEGQLFRLEKTIQIKITEAKILKPGPYSEQHGRHSKDRDLRTGNYLAEVILDGEVRSRTMTQTDTKAPFWREESQFTDLPAALPLLSVLLKRVDGNLETSSHQLQASLGLPKTGNLTEVLCGAVDIPLSQLECSKTHEQWLNVLDETNEPMASMFLRIQHDESLVLSIADYKPLADLLQQANFNLTNQIATVIPSALRRIAEIFLNIFQVSGMASEWLQALVEEEIDGLGNQNTTKKLRFSRRLKSNDSNASGSEREALVRDMSKSLAGEANLLFRGNSLLTQALECHMRRLGKEYLEVVLSERIFEINELNPDCEVDPSRIRNHEDMDRHWAQLITHTSKVWKCIEESVQKLPGELRQILKYVRGVAEDRYGDFLRTVSFTSVSGFLFLRFICPAILNPKLSGLLRDNPRPDAQRTLTLVAKGLQALTNLATFGKKESWMEPMNQFLYGHRQPFKDFIDSVCSISSEKTALHINASYSTPNTIVGRLPPMSRGGIPSLPYLIDDARNYATLVNLWLDLSPTSSAVAPQDLDGELAEFDQRCKELQQRTDACLAQIESIREMEDANSITDELVESLDSVTLSYGYPAWHETDPYRPPGSSGSDAESHGQAAFSLFGKDIHVGRLTSPSALEAAYPAGSTGTIRFKDRNGRHPRNFINGLLGKKRSASPAMVRAKSRDKDKDKGRGDKEKSRERGGLLGLTEAWHSDTSSKQDTVR
ncbi:Rho GTPase activation protein [Microdochium bolleyi]|uniref:Rho GTPase activation protein n=1 Tax=Microdochium bolleyi TaxID=196109 RepID=A0A136J4L1_9PEZI|nr:Rho GTPase activation protein [Microdochium bolleyi]